MSSSNNSPNTPPPTSSPPAPSSSMIYTGKRVTRTYGSKRVEALSPDDSPDADKSFGTLVDGDFLTPPPPSAHSRGIDGNVASSQETKVDEEEDSSPKANTHRWDWKDKLKELDSDEEHEPIPHVDGSPSALQDRSPRSKGKRPSISPKKFQRLPLADVRSDSRAPARISVEPEDVDRSPPPKPRRRISRKAANATAVEDSESEVPHASSSKSRGTRLNSADVDTNDRARSDSIKQKRKTTTGRKPTAKVSCHDILLLILTDVFAKARRQEEEELKKNQARIAAERHIEFPVVKQPVTQYSISSFCNNFQWVPSLLLRGPSSAGVFIGPGYRRRRENPRTTVQNPKISKNGLLQ